MTAILLGPAYLGLALGWASPVVYCSAELERCPGAISSSGEAQGSADCCAHEENQDSRPDCCVTIAEKGLDWVLPSHVKIPDLTGSACCPPAVPSPLELVRLQDAPTLSNSPDPPGLAGRSLLIRVSRQLV